MLMIIVYSVVCTVEVSEMFFCLCQNWAL